MTPKEQDALESLIDTCGLYSVLDGLSGLCGLKAEHLRLQWQDENTAQAWERAESALNKAASQILDLAL